MKSWLERGSDAVFFLVMYSMVTGVLYWAVVASGPVEIIVHHQIMIFPGKSIPFIYDRLFDPFAIGIIAAIVSLIVSSRSTPYFCWTNSLVGGMFFGACLIGNDVAPFAVLIIWATASEMVETAARLDASLKEWAIKKGRYIELGIGIGTTVPATLFEGGAVALLMLSYGAVYWLVGRGIVGIMGEGMFRTFKYLIIACVALFFLYSLGVGVSIVNEVADQTQPRVKPVIQRLLGPGE